MFAVLRGGGKDEIIFHKINSYGYDFTLLHCHRVTVGKRHHIGKELLRPKVRPFGYFFLPYTYVYDLMFLESFRGIAYLDFGTVVRSSHFFF